MPSQTVTLSSRFVEFLQVSQHVLQRLPGFEPTLLSLMPAFLHLPFSSPVEGVAYIS